VDQNHCVRFAAVLFSAATIGGIAWYRQSVSSAEALQRESAADLTLVETDMAAQRKTASALVVALAGQPDTARLIAANAREEILSRYSASLPSIIADGGVQLVTFINANGEAVSRIHTPDKFGDDMKGRRKTVVQALSTGKLVAGIEPGRTAVSMFATAPVIRDGKVVGAVDAGTALANDYFKSVAERIGGEIAVQIMVDGKFVKQAATSEASLLSEEGMKTAFAGQRVQEELSVGDRQYVVAALPFTNFSGETIGVLEIASDVTSVAQAAREALWTTVIGTAIVSLLSLLGFFLFAKSLAGVIGRITGTMGQLADGNLDAAIEGETRTDEVGAMARAVQVFKENALRTRELERDADQQRSLTEEERQRNAEQERLRAEAMSKATSGLAEGLKQLAAGNLAVKLDQPFADDFESLRTDFNSAVEQLRSTLTAVATATNGIDSGSREVSQSANDLAKRTEQQAAALEETAAALDQITVNVTNSSKRADEARKTAIQANESAAQSGRVVADAIDAMQKIEQSSTQISSIIGVIDKIAFQTNLLALNAGVEAARAGDAGRGFAVVAQEVRELAQRSAKAAKEIKDLIRNSSIEVQSGVKLVSDTGEVLRTIEAYIVTVNQHMDSIATSAKEQSIGLAEVNTAVNQMDQVTQQNAAMVEETSAAGATLANESGRLRELISQFQLGGALHHTASGAAAGPAHRPVVSSVKRMANKVALAFSGNAAVKESWEEF
jgi:methyl-accepting chemotaxis protein